MRYILIIFCLVNFMSANLITPIPKEIVHDKEKALLGKRLFSDKKLSRDNTISCESCHSLTEGGDDGRVFSIGIKKRVGNINAPTVFNTVFNIAQFWDGRATNLQEQILHVFKNPKEMDTDIKGLPNKLKADKAYKNMFNFIYPDGITLDNIVDAIAEFEKTLITPDSKFDRYLRGDKSALNQKELEGYKLFKSYGCISCHNGVGMGGNLFQKIGIMKPYIDKTNNLGRYNVTKDEDDKQYFKVPSLRNVALTAPYFHDGSQKTLEDAITNVIIYQLGRIPNTDDVEKLEIFLHTLTGKMPSILGKNK